MSQLHGHSIQQSDTYALMWSKQTLSSSDRGSEATRRGADLRASRHDGHCTIKGVWGGGWARRHPLMGAPPATPVAAHSHRICAEPRQRIELRLGLSTGDCDTADTPYRSNGAVEARELPAAGPPGYVRSLCTPSACVTALRGQTVRR